jgi:hypothetical protein
MSNIKTEKATSQTVAKRNTTLTEQRKEELLNKVSTGGSTSRGGTWTLGADIDSLDDITTQVSKYAGMVVALGGKATPNEVDKFSETSTGNLFWGYANGTQYEQKPSKIMFGTYFDKATGKVEWSKSKGKKEILTYTS